ncbi:MAG: hypothetical protein ACQEXX_25195 [Bacillota bacterium]
MSAILLSGCSSDDGGSIKQEAAGESPISPVTTQNQQENNDSEKNKTWSSENNEVKVSVVKVDKYGTPEVVSVEVNGLKKEFNWQVAEEPRVFYTDVTGNSKPEDGIVAYGLENQEIFSYFGGSVGTSPIYVCRIHVTYKFDSLKNEFVVDQIKPESYE